MRSAMRLVLSDTTEWSGLLEGILRGGPKRAEQLRTHWLRELVGLHRFMCHMRNQQVFATTKANIEQTDHHCTQLMSTLAEWDLSSDAEAQTVRSLSSVYDEALLSLKKAIAPLIHLNTLDDTVLLMELWKTLKRHNSMESLVAYLDNPTHMSLLEQITHQLYIKSDYYPILPTYFSDQLQHITVQSCSYCQFMLSLYNLTHIVASGWFHSHRALVNSAVNHHQCLLVALTKVHSLQKTALNQLERYNGYANPDDEQRAVVTLTNRWLHPSVQIIKEVLTVFGLLIPFDYFERNNQERITQLLTIGQDSIGLLNQLSRRMANEGWNENSLCTIKNLLNRAPHLGRILCAVQVALTKELGPLLAELLNAGILLFNLNRTRTIRAH